MLPQDIIALKRDKQNLTKEHIDFFVKGVTKGTIADAQIAALTMAVVLNGMNVDEVAYLTSAMRDSGKVLKWDKAKLHGPVVDKHSTGGVGDLVSLVLAPLLMACGAYVPMISGKGLGHTGGTTDKMEAIPGYKTEISVEKLQKSLEEVGGCITTQTKDINPADKKIYAVRDITATAYSIELITASIISKKLVPDLDGLVMDVKTGNGAFIAEYEETKKLAQSLTLAAKNTGLNIVSLITDMNQPLARSAGNSLEVIEALDILSNKQNKSRLRTLIIEQAADVLTLTKLYANKEEAIASVTKNLENGKALEKFAKMVAFMGGPNDFVENHQKYLGKANFIKDIKAEESGYVCSYDTKEVGLTVVALGGGRAHPDDKLNYQVGLDNLLEVGTYVNKGDTIATIHAKDENDFLKAEKQLRASLVIKSEKPKETTLIYEYI